MDYEFDIITRDQIPSKIYLCGKNDENDWKKINYFKFENGLECVIGSGRYLSAKDAIDSVKSELDYIIDIDRPDELQTYFFENFDNFIPYQDCVKIWNYYFENEVLIKEAYYSYFDKEDTSDNDNMEEEEEEATTHKFIIDDDIRDKIEDCINKYCEKYVSKAIQWARNKVQNKVNKKFKQIDEKLVLF